MYKRYPSCAAWLASAALLISGGCASAQAPIIDAGSSYGTSATPAAGRTTPQPVAADAQGSSGSLLLQIQSLQQEVMELRGIVEEQNHQIETLKQQSLDRYLELDRRISGGAAAAGAAVGAGAATASSVPAASGTNSGGAIDATAPVEAQGAMATGAGAVGNGVATGSAPPQANEYEAYKQAYAKVKEQNFTAATQAFDDFIKTYPSSTLTPNAYYWLGELHLQTPQDLDAAEKAFDHVVKDYPQHGKAPDSLYKLGRVYFMKGDKQRARDTLQQVIDEYGASGSSAPQLAKQFLDQNFR